MKRNSLKLKYVLFVTFFVGAAVALRVELSAARVPVPVPFSVPVPDDANNGAFAFDSDFSS